MLKTFEEDYLHMNISGKPKKKTSFLHLFTCPAIVLFKWKRRNGHCSPKDLKRGRQKDRQVGQFSVQQHLNQSNRHGGGKRREGRKDKDAIHSALGRGCYGYSRRPTGPAGRQTRLGRVTGGDEGVGR